MLAGAAAAAGGAERVCGLRLCGELELGAPNGLLAHDARARAKALDVTRRRDGGADEVHGSGDQSSRFAPF